MKNSKEKPVINQVELHPLLSQEELRAFCKEQGIAVEAWSPLARGLILEEPGLVGLAEKYEKSVAQIILRWHIQNDIIVIPKSVAPARLKENTEIFDFQLTNEDMEFIDRLNENKRFGPDPDNFSF
jgi:diketogulonate reductase-like aldo/keto reductase